MKQTKKKWFYFELKINVSIEKLTRNYLSTGTFIFPSRIIRIKYYLVYFSFSSPSYSSSSDLQYQSSPTCLAEKDSEEKWAILWKRSTSTRISVHLPKNALITITTEMLASIMCLFLLLAASSDGRSSLLLITFSQKKAYIH